MKRIIFLIAMALTLGVAFPQQSMAQEASLSPLPIIQTEYSQNEFQESILLNRLEEINQMDKGHLTFREKRELRREVKDIQRQLEVTHGGLYLSAGAVIVIAILLIILL